MIERCFYGSSHIFLYRKVKSTMIVYVSGVHGAGKSTLIDKLTSYMANGSEKARLDRITLEYSTIDPYERAALRTMQYFLESRRAASVKIINKEPIYLGDRCIWDTITYIRAYRRLGWVTESEHAELQTRICQIFSDILPQNILILLPSIKRVVINLENRWRSGRVGWREKDLNYLHVVMQEYECTFKELKSLYGEKVGGITSDRHTEVFKMAIEYLGSLKHGDS